MNNLVTEAVTPKPGNPVVSMVKISVLLLIALFTASVGLYLLLPPADRPGFAQQMDCPAAGHCLHTAVVAISYTG